MTDQDRSSDAPAVASKFQRAGSLSAFNDSDRLAATVNGTHIVVFRLNGSFVATPAVCPHAGGPLCDATIEGNALACAWHGYNFSLHTGECDDDPDLTLKLYEVRVVGDDVLIKLE